MWEIIWYDVLYKIKTKLSLMTTNHLQIYNSMAEILAGAFGKKKDAPIKINDLPAQQAVDTINQILAGGG